MCSWCWGFSRAWQQTLANLPAGVRVVRLLGGLAADNHQPMPQAMREALAETWRTIAAHVPGVEFNYEFWSRCKPRRATYPACRAVIAARRQGQQFDTAMTYAIQRAYYLQARNPSEEATLISLAAELGLDTEAFSQTLGAAQTHQELLREISLARGLGADSFPSLVLETAAGRWHIPIDYHSSRPMLDTISELSSSRSSRH